MKRALLIGIDHFDAYNELRGCVNDVEALEPLLRRNADKSPNFETQTRTSATSGVTRDELLEDLDTLLGGGADVALLYYAGHGTEDRNDVSLVTADGTEQTPGIAFSSILAMIQNSPVREIIVILDCCFSGAAGSVPQLGSSATTLRGGVSILAASRSDQTAAETDAGRGVFSTFLCGGLDGGAADVLGKVTVAGLYSYLDESFGAWDQRPAFKANVDRLHELRRCEPAVALSDLREIDTLFERADGLYQLDKSYEPTEEPHDPEHERIFKVLQDYRDAKLLKQVDAPHMYGAAMAGTGCRLTPLGRHYWQLAREGRL